MLTTWTWLPPTWLAMLPQKFSAAATWMTPAWAPFPVSPDAVLHAASSALAAASRAAARRNGRRARLAVLALPVLVFVVPAAAPPGRRAVAYLITWPPQASSWESQRRRCSGL